MPTPTPRRLAPPWLAALPWLAAAAGLAPAAAPATPAAAAATSAAAAAPTTPATPADGPGTGRPLACTDFYAHVNAEWEARTELPPDRARIGSFDILRRDNDRLLAAALVELVAEPARQTSPGLQRLAAFYASGMDEAGIARAGTAPVEPWLARIDAVTPATLPALLGELARFGVGQPLRPFVGTDFADARRHLVVLTVGGLGLPDRSDYTRDDAASARLRDGYRTYLKALFGAAGRPLPEAGIDALMALERALGEAQLTPAERRDPQATNHRRTRAQLAADAPGFDWNAWLDAWSGGTRFDTLNLTQPRAAKAFAQLVAATPIETWRLYLAARLLDHAAPLLAPAFEQASFAYRSGVIRGVPAAPSRAERVIGLISGNNGSAPMGEALGELYVARAYSPRAQQRALAMVADIREAMKRRITALPWMSAPTKQAALAKLDAMVAQIGHPERWSDWQGLEIRAGDFAGNVWRAERWRLAERLAELDKPVDRLRWTTSAHVVNAFAAGGNRIVFPAGILQPPFFDENADDASNYGAIGMVIGHEITHHFDDRGRQYDAVGNLRDWWTPEDAAAYKARADRVVEVYGAFEPLPGVRINGRQMLGENISDFGGLHIAYDGLQIALARQRAAGEPAPAIDGLTPSQRFFTANAVIWRNRIREASLLNQLRTGQHSPGRYRVLAPMAHQPAFARAFGCRPGDPMAAADPILIW